jgi:hypothetical protein
VFIRKSAVLQRDAIVSAEGVLIILTRFDFRVDKLFVKWWSTLRDIWHSPLCEGNFVLECDVVKSGRYTSISTFQRNQRPPSPTFIAEAADNSETSVHMYQSIHFRTPEDGYTHSQNYRAFSLLQDEPLLADLMNFSVLFNDAQRRSDPAARQQWTSAKV